MFNSKNVGQARPMCSSDICDCKNQKCDYIHKQYGLKRWVFRLIIITIIVGLIVPFAAEAILPLFTAETAKIENGLAVWNQFVSIILGIVATVLSIVSIIMGFKNYEDTLAVQEKYMQALERIEAISSDVHHMGMKVDEMASQNNPTPVFSPTPQNEVWDQEPEGY